MAWAVRMRLAQAGGRWRQNSCRPRFRADNDNRTSWGEGRIARVGSLRAVCGVVGVTRCVLDRLDMAKQQTTQGQAQAQAAAAQTPAGDPSGAAGAVSAGAGGVMAADGAGTGIAASWTQVWQMPVLMVGLAMLSIGLWSALPSSQENDFPAALDEAAMLLDASELEQAQAKLQTIRAHLDQASELQKGRFSMLWGDLVYLQQAESGSDLESNHQRIVSYYRQARDAGITLDAQHIQRWADTLVALGQHEDALEMLDQLTGAGAARRYLVIRRIIERHRQADASPAELTPLLTRFLEEVRLETNHAQRRRNEIWAVDLMAQGMLRSRDPQRAIDYLIQKMIRFKADGQEKDLAVLTVRLAQAFEQVGDMDEARRYYHLAMQQMDVNDPLNADALVGLGQILLAGEGDVHTALERFTQAASDYPQVDPNKPGFQTYLRALVGRGECEARLGAHNQAGEHFSMAVEILAKHPRRRPEAIVRRLEDVVFAQYDLHTDRQEYDRALQYLSVLPPLHDKELPPSLLVRFAVTHERVAEQRREQAEQAAADDMPASAQRLRYQQSAEHFALAADYFRRHAHSRRVADDAEHGMSLWRAASCYDQAQMWKQAIDVYAEFIRSRSQQDPRYQRALRKLALAYQADGQYKAAIELFNQLVEQSPKSLSAASSLVPLARCHMTLGDFDTAQRTLEFVLSNHKVIGPESPHYRDALIELGTLHYRRDRFDQAIVSLDEAVGRYGDTVEDGPELWFLLADAYRRSIEKLDEELTQPMPPSLEAQKRAERAKRLQTAQQLYTRVIDTLEAERFDSLSQIEQVYFRNAYFYRGDCAFDRGEYAQAIGLYETAAKRWDQHPASMVALVQIVNAYCELDQTQQARAANKRAQWQLNRIPDDAFDDPTLPMTRQHWQDWLRWTSELDLFGS